MMQDLSLFSRITFTKHCADCNIRGLENMEDPDGYNAFVSQRSIQFAEQDQDRSVDSKTLYIPPPWSRDKGKSA